MMETIGKPSGAQKKETGKQAGKKPLGNRQLIALTVVLIIVGALFFYLIDGFHGLSSDILERNRNIPFQYLFNLYYPDDVCQPILLKAILSLVLVELFIQFVTRGRLKTWQCFILQMLVFLTFFISMEIILKSINMKQIHFTRPHPAIIWENIPKYRSSYGHLYFNRDGFRSEEVSVRKPAGEKRILIVGDSCMFGFKLPQDLTIGYQLEEILNERDKRAIKWKVLNAAVIGHTTSQGRYILEKRGLKYQPDYILVGYNNDSMSSPILDSEQSGNKSLLSIRLLLYKSEIFLTLRKMVSIYKLQRILMKNDHKFINSERKARITREQCRENIKYFIGKSGNNIIPIILVMPTKPSDIADMDSHKKIMKDTALKFDSPLLDLNDFFKKNHKREKLFLPNSSLHFNSDGVEIAAEYISKKIMELEKDRGELKDKSRE